jgi:hypothetical protein
LAGLPAVRRSLVLPWRRAGRHRRLAASDCGSADWSRDASAADRPSPARRALVPRRFVLAPDLHRLRALREIAVPPRLLVLECLDDPFQVRLPVGGLALRRGRAQLPVGGQQLGRRHDLVAGVVFDAVEDDQRRLAGHEAELSAEPADLAAVDVVVALQRRDPVACPHRRGHRPGLRRAASGTSISCSRPPG